MRASPAFCGLLLCAVFSMAEGHIASNGFLRLEVEGKKVTGALELAVRDAEIAVGVDLDRDGRVTWGELRQQEPVLAAYVAAHLTLAGDAGRCVMSLSALRVNERVDGAYAWLPISAICPAPANRLAITYTLLRDFDPSHRGLLTLSNGGATQTAVLGGDATPRAFALDRLSAWYAFREYLAAGVWHIWSGIDHLLFLVSLLLPAVLLRREGRWTAVPVAWPAFVNILKVVTAFTLAHSVTLSLAAFEVVRLPARLTESVIAASIIVAALNNIFPRITEGRWRLAFAFGLLHGFGFASVLADMGLPPGARLVSLVAFNLGIEVGQLAVVLAIMPVAYAIRATAFYRRGVLPWGSTGIALLAFVWFVQRVAG